MLRRMNAFALACVGLAFFLAAGQAAAQRVALLVGNAGYAAAPLLNPHRDVRRMEEALKAVGFKVQVVLDANQNEMKRAVRDFGAKAEGADVAFFYYSGHGVQAGGENFLIPLQARVDKEADYEIETIAANSVLRQISGAKPKAAIVVLDACRDNPFVSSTKSASKGLGRMDAPTGSMIAFATAPNTTASDEGYYARVLASQITTPGLELLDVFRNTTSEVRRLSSGKQEPRMSEVSISERIYLAGQDPAARTGGVAAASPAAPRPASSDGQLPVLVLGDFGGDMSNSNAVSRVIRNDLDRSGKFRVKESDGVAVTENTRPSLNQWKEKGVNYLIGGSTSLESDGRINVLFRLWDMDKGVDLGGKSYTVQPSDLRLGAHRIADFVHQKITGVLSSFSERVAQVTQSGGRFALLVSDSDGANAQTALASPAVIALPTWQKEGANVGYFSFESGKPTFYIHELRSGKRAIAKTSSVLVSSCAQEIDAVQSGPAGFRDDWLKDNWMRNSSPNCTSAVQATLRDAG